MSPRSWVTLTVCGSVAAVAAVGYTQCWYAGDTTRPPPRTGQDLATHPIYSRYEFGHDDHVVDVGIQPLWIPTNMIMEVMRRDAVLRRALSNQGVEVRFHAFLKGADVNYFLRRGDLEVAIGGDMPALTAAAESEVLVAALVQQGFCAIVARDYMLIDDLRGKRIGYPFGSNAHYALLNTLSRAGLRETDVHLVSLDVNQMCDALRDDKIDAFSAWEPTPFLAQTQYRGQVVVHRSLSSGYLYFSRSFANGHREAAREIVAAVVRATSWMGTEKNLLKAGKWALAEGREMSGQPPALSAEDYVGLAKNDLLGTASIPAIPEGDLAVDGPLAKEFEFLRTIGMIPKTAKWGSVRSCFDRSLMREVLAASRQYSLRTYDYLDDEGENHEPD